MRILLTGATGFIGRHLLGALRADGHDVVPLVRDPAALNALSGGWEGTVKTGDLRDPAIGQAVLGCDVVVHLAALSDAGASRGDPVPSADVNAAGTLHLLEGARAAGAGFLLASSQLVYEGQLGPIPEDAAKLPSTPYGYSKLVAETWVQMYSRLFGVPAIVVRFFSVYGPGQYVRGTESGVVSIFGQRALRGEPLVVMSRSRRDFTHVSDAVAGIRVLLSSRTAWGGVYNVATGAGSSLLDLAQHVIRASDSPSEILDESTDSQETNRIADISLVRSFGYSPSVKLEDGIRDYVRWLRAASEDIAEGAPHAGSAR